MSDVGAAAVIAALASIVQDCLRGPACNEAPACRSGERVLLPAGVRVPEGARFHLIEWWGGRGRGANWAVSRPGRAGSRQRLEAKAPLLPRDRSRDGELLQAGGQTRRPPRRGGSGSARCGPPRLPQQPPRRRSTEAPVRPRHACHDDDEGHGQRRSAGPHLAPAEMREGVTLLDLALAGEAV